MKIFLVFLSCFILYNNGFNQDQEFIDGDTNIGSKNAILVDAGTIAFLSQIMVFYERKFKINKEKRIVFGGQIGAGIFTIPLGDPIVPVFSPNFFILKGNYQYVNNFEFTFGANISIPNTEYYLIPSVNFGYRYQKKGLIFRIGAGYPKGPYIGIGGRF